jgi:hypothetical protein
MRIGCSLRGLAPALGGVAEALRWAASHGLRFVSIDATDPATRPSRLGADDRRTLAATLRRSELMLCGVDAIIPAEHLADPARADRAVSAVIGAMTLARDCFDRRAAVPGMVVSIAAPASPAPGVMTALAEEAVRHGVRLGVLGDGKPGTTELDLDAIGRAGGDSAAWIAAHGSRLVAMRLGVFDRATLAGLPAVAGASGVVCPDAHLVADLRQTRGRDDAIRALLHALA